MTPKNTITVKRPDGTIEVVDVTARFPFGLTNKIFARMRDATIAAGRGTPLKYDNAKADADRANRGAKAQRRRAFDALYNEGAGGYNPYRR
jgi:hypothetical protein